MWSDHAPAILTYTLTEYHRTQRKPWRLNESLLQDSEVIADVTKEITEYFRTNTDTDSKAGLIWEAHKPVIRGVLIKHGARLKKQRKAQLTSLLDKLHTLETKHKQTPTGTLGTELDTIRRQITDLLTFKAKSFARESTSRVTNVVDF